MVGVVFLNIILNAFFFSFIFWLLTFISKFLYSNKYFNYKLNFYECGFKNITKKKISYEINFSLLLLFLLLYDGEFLVLIPLALNTSLITFSIGIAVFFFLAWLIIALLVDYSFNALDWQI